MRVKLLVLIALLAEALAATQVRRLPQRSETISVNATTYYVPVLKVTDGLGAQWLVGAGVMGVAMCRSNSTFAWPGIRSLAHFDPPLDRSMALVFDDFVGLSHHRDVVQVGDIPKGANKERLRHVAFSYAVLPCVRRVLRAAYHSTPKPRLPKEMKSPEHLHVAVHVRRGDIAAKHGSLRFSSVELYCDQLPLLAVQMAASMVGLTKRVRFHIFSEAEGDPAELPTRISASCFRDHSGSEVSDVVHHLDVPLDVTVHAMVTADVLVRATSSLSDAAAAVRVGPSSLITERWVGRKSAWYLSGRGEGRHYQSSRSLMATRGPPRGVHSRQGGAALSDDERVKLRDIVGKKPDYYRNIHDDCCDVNSACCSNLRNKGEMYPGG